LEGIIFSKWPTCEFPTVAAAMIKGENFFFLFTTSILRNPNTPFIRFGSDSNRKQDRCFVMPLTRIGLIPWFIKASMYSEKTKNVGSEECECRCLMIVVEVKKWKNVVVGWLVKVVIRDCWRVGEILSSTSPLFFFFQVKYSIKFNFGYEWIINFVFEFASQSNSFFNLTKYQNSPLICKMSINLVILSNWSVNSTDVTVNLSNVRCHVSRD